MTQLEVVRAILVYLQENGTSDYRSSLNAAINSVSQSVYNSIDAVVEDIWVKYSNSSSVSDFLLTYCGIDTTNIDCGSIFGSDAGGSTSISKYDLVPESGSVADLVYPASNSTVVYGDKISITYPNISSYSQQNTFLVGCLHTFWMNGCVERFSALFDLPTIEFNFGLDTSDPDFIAAVRSYTISGQPFPVQQDLLYNPFFTADLDLTDLNGSGSRLGSMLLDACTLHELTHGVHNMCIPYCSRSYPSWFKEGLATTVEGGDMRRVALNSYLSNITEASLNVDFRKMTLDQYSNGEFPYVQGYMFFRFLAKQIGQDIPPTPPVPPTPSGDYTFYDLGDKLLAKGTALTLHDVGRRFIQFAQETGENIQAWELVQDKFFSFNGATFRVAMKNWEINSNNQLNDDNADNENDDNIEVNSNSVIDADFVGSTENVPYFYISLQYQKVTSNTYNQYLNAVGSPYLSILTIGNGSGGVNGLNTVGNRHYSANNLRYRTEQNNASSLGNVNLFMNTGEFIAISPHTLFDKNLWMCEQAGNSCFALSEDGSALNLRKYTDNVYSGCNSQGSTQDITPIPFPGSGTPWLTISDTNINTYVTELTPIHYWFTKTDYSATITFRLHDGVNDDLYQSVSFGMLTNIKESSYMFPLYVAGGNMALFPQVVSASHLHATCPSPLFGNVYDLNMDNICMSNSNLLHSTFFNGATATNFKILSPQGYWKYVGTHTQSAQSKQPYECRCGGSGCPPSQTQAVLGVVTDVTNAHNFITPNGSVGFKYTIDTYTVNQEYKTYIHGSPLHKLFVFLDDNLNYKENGCMGVLPNVYSGWFKGLPCGEILISDKAYLSVPNGWETRLWHYQSNYGTVVNDADTIDKLKARFSDSVNPLKNNIIQTRVLIPMDRGN